MARLHKLPDNSWVSPKHVYGIKVSKAYQLTGEPERWEVAIYFDAIYKGHCSEMMHVNFFTEEKAVEFAGNFANVVNEANG